MELKPLSNYEEYLGKEIVDSAFKVHKQLGGGLLEKIYLFKIDMNFTISIIPYLRMLSVLKTEIIYREDDPAEESKFQTVFRFFDNNCSFLHFGGNSQLYHE